MSWRRPEALSRAAAFRDRERDYEGDVYNMEVEEEHNYLAGFLLVSQLPELVDLPGPARLQRRRPAPPGHATPARRRRPPRERPPGRLQLQRAAHHRRVGRQPSSARRRPPAWPVPSSPTATPRPRCSTTCAPGSSPTRSTSRASTTATTAASAARWRTSPDTIRMVHERGIWLEVVTLVIPGFNDSDGRAAPGGRLPRLGQSATFPGTSPRSTRITR